MALIESWDADELLRKLHHLFEVLVRFVASEYIAISNFLASFADIVAGLRLEVKSITPEMKAKINGWLRCMLQFKIVAYLIVTSDVHTANKVFSTRVQSDSSLVIEVPTFLDDYKVRLQKLCSSLGPECNRRLPLLIEGKIAMQDFKKPDRVLVFKDATTR